MIWESIPHNSKKTLWVRVLRASGSRWFVSLELFLRRFLQGAREEGLVLLAVWEHKVYASS